MSQAMTHDPRRVTVRAPAKINLHLEVGAPREDGFHPLATVYQAVGLYDDVTVSTWHEWSVQVRYEGLLADPDVSGASADPGRVVPLDAENVAVRAGRALVDHHGVDLAAAITIHSTLLLSMPTPQVTEVGQVCRLHPLPRPHGCPRAPRVKPRGLVTASR